MYENFHIILSNKQYFNIFTQIVGVKIIKDKLTGVPAGYGFLEFDTHETAAHILQHYNSVPIPGSQKAFKLNWGTHGGAR